MSTTSERMAEAFKRATGEEVDPPKRLAIMRGKYTLDATPGYGGGALRSPRHGVGGGFTERCVQGQDSRFVHQRHQDGSHAARG